MLCQRNLMALSTCFMRVHLEYVPWSGSGLVVSKAHTTAWHDLAWWTSLSSETKHKTIWFIQPRVTHTW